MATLSLRERVKAIRKEGRPISYNQLRQAYKAGGVSYKMIKINRRWRKITKPEDLVKDDMALQNLKRMVM